MGREQNIGLGAINSLSSDNMRLKGGVTLTQFKPFKIKENAQNDADLAPDDEKQKLMTFEEKMALRAAQEEGVEKQPMVVINGGKYQKEKCMSLDQYKKINPSASRAQ